MISSREKTGFMNIGAVMILRVSIIGLALTVPPALSAAEHWSLKPRTRPAVPEIDSKWVRNPLYVCVLAGMHKAAQASAGEADPATRIRRLTFDLTGLPPTPAEIED